MKIPFRKRLRAAKNVKGVTREETARRNGVSAAEIAPKLGLRVDTVEALMDLADMANQDVLGSVDAAVCAVVASVETAYDDMISTVSGILEEFGNDEEE